MKVLGARWLNKAMFHGQAGGLGLLLLLLLLFGGTVCAQAPAEIAQLRQGIEAQRAAVERTHATEKAACYKQFVVNDCLFQAKQKRSAAMAEFKRQEVVLNDEERKRKAAVQMRKLEERSSVAAQQSAAEQRAQRVDAAQKSQARMDDKLRDSSKVVAPSQGLARATPQKQTPKARQPVAPKVSNNDTAQHLSGFKQKQQDALAHKAEVEKARRERTKPLAAPLPGTGAPPTPLALPLAAP